MISWDDFEKVDIRTGTILEVNEFRVPESRLINSQLTLANWVSKVHRHK